MFPKYDINQHKKKTPSQVRRLKPFSSIRTYLYLMPTKLIKLKMTLLIKLALLTTLITIPVLSETDNFNIPITGTLDNTAPDSCSITPPRAVSLRTLNVHDLLNNESVEIDSIGQTAYNTNVRVDIEVICTVGTSYSIYLDSPHFLDDSTGAGVELEYLPGRFLTDIAGGEIISGTGTGAATTHRTYVFISKGMNTNLTDISGATSITLALTLEAL